MERLILVLSAVMLLSPFSLRANPSCYDVVPLPQKIELKAGMPPFVFDEDTEVYYTPDPDGNMERNAGFLAGYISASMGFVPEVRAVDKGRLSSVLASGNIVLLCNPSLEVPAEGYIASVDGHGFVIKGSAPEGVFYGIQMLRKAILSAKDGGKAVFSAAKIVDFPRFGYRGAHFDVCRHFFTVDEVKRYIDMMAVHNMNTLHWHITDDQGWRIEIKRYPKLAEKGSVRKGTLVGHLNDRPQKYDGKTYGGYYTQDEVRELVRYAAERYIDIVPEVDLPGHMLAALAAYPELGCTGGPYEVWMKWGVSEDVLCAGNDAVPDFLDGVFSEILDLFPSEYIHIGGDECPKDRWAACPKCQAKAAELGLKDDSLSSKEEKLQGYLMEHVAKFLQSKGRKVIGWDEILDGGAADDIVVMSWRGEKGGIKAAKLGHDVIMTPNSHLYFDYYQGQDISREPLAIGGYIPLEAVYNYNPVPKALGKRYCGRIVGVQANLWTEYIDTFSHVQYMVLPRWAALAENQWNCPAHKDYDAFLDRLENLIEVYDIEGYAYARHVFEVSADIRADAERGVVKVDYKTMGMAPVHYTFDGTKPTEASPIFEKTLEIGTGVVLTAAAFRNGDPSSFVSDTIVFNPATAKPVKLLYSPSDRYTFSGAEMLVDGLKGDSVFGSGRWLGFEACPLDAVIDLKSRIPVSSVRLGVCVNTADGVFDARKIAVSVSDDGKNFRTVALKNFRAMEKETKEVKRHFLSFPETSVRFVRVTAVPEMDIPAWSWLRGSSAFIFCDEIEVGSATRADIPEVSYVGRTSVSPEGFVRYDWTGTYFSTTLHGDRLDAEIEVKGESWFNVFVDDSLAGNFSVKDADTLVTLAEGLGAGSHEVKVQKRTEGEYGMVTVKGFVLPAGCGLSPVRARNCRHIEFIGNSLTCGFGTEGKDRNEPFKVSTENCNLSYAAIISRYFDADYTMIAHSGQGAVRNYGDSLTVSSLCMQGRMLRTFDTDTLLWRGNSYVPDLVVINLGTNDFSLPPYPCEKEFVDGYCNLISQIFSLYGKIPVLCVCPPTTGEPLPGYLEKVHDRMQDAPVYLMVLTRGLYNDNSDLGSAWHPNYSGQLKMAMGIIPYISTITGWEMMPGKTVE